MVLNSRGGGLNKRGGYYIELFGHYIKITSYLFIYFFLKNPDINKNGATAVRYYKVAI